MTDKKISNQLFESYAALALQTAEVLSPTKAKGEKLKTRAKGLILQNPLPGYDPRNRRFTQSHTDAQAMELPK